jgi:hypothetical protein
MRSRSIVNRQSKHLTPSTQHTNNKRNLVAKRTVNGQAASSNIPGNIYNTTHRINLYSSIVYTGLTKSKKQPKEISRIRISLFSLPWPVAKVEEVEQRLASLVSTVHNFACII